ncbi:hypothetical protein Dimus_022902, partial [Dionaea muscipula]
MAEDSTTRRDGHHVWQQLFLVDALAIVHEVGAAHDRHVSASCASRAWWQLRSSRTPAAVVKHSCALLLLRVEWSVMIAVGGAGSADRCRDPRRQGGWLLPLTRAMGGGDRRGPPWG